MSGGVVVDAAVKILRAMQRGTIPADNVDKGYGCLRVYLFTHGESPKTVEWYENAFPGGRHAIYRRACDRTRRLRTRPRYWDRWRYMADLDDSKHRWVEVHYSKPHECVNFIARTEYTTLTGDAAKDVPRWYCQDCKKDMTVTEARRRGLLPPLRSKS